METRSKILVAVFLLVSLYLKAAPCPPFGIDCAHIPRSGDVSIQITNTPGSISARVSVTIPSACYRVRGWGTPIRDGSTILAQAEFFASGSGYCAQVIVTTTTEYDLGFLEPGRYRFAFYASGQLVKTTTFDVLEPESLGTMVLDPSIAETSYLDGAGAFSVESETGGSDSGSWQAYSLQDWLSISGVSKGPSGSVTYAAQANPSASVGGKNSIRPKNAVIRECEGQS